MTFAELLSSLKALNSDAALIFETDGDAIGAGYHVTELRHSLSTGIDCGGHIETWEEARLQLLDGASDTHMRVGKFRDILERSLGKLPELSGAKLLAEFAVGNAGLRLMTVGEPIVTPRGVTVELGDSRALCKPAQRRISSDISVASCCGAANLATGVGEACCA